MTRNLIQKAHNNAAQKVRYRQKRVEILAYKRAHYHANKEAFYVRFILARYGVTQADYEGMLKAQGGLCAICHRSGKDSHHGRLAIDHSHETGKVRGLLCTDCNNGLGRFRDQLELLDAAKAYLLKTK